MGEPILGNSRISTAEFIGSRGERGELKHLSTLGKENNRDSQSSGERNGKSLNRVYASLQALYIRSCGTLSEGVADPSASHKSNG